MWAGTDAIKSQGLLPGREASGVVIGTWDGEPLIDTTLKPIAVLGPCRSGKTTSIFVPSLLTWQHSAVVLDIGGELFNLTERWRRVGVHNDVRRVQFMDSASPDSYNFLEAIRHGTQHELSDIQALAASFIPDEDRGDGRLTAQARSLVTLLMIAALSVNRSACMADVYEVLKSSDRIDAIIDAHLKFSFDTEVFQAAKTIATALAELDDWTRATIIQKAGCALTLFACPEIAENTRRCSFSFADLQSRSVPTTVYLTVIPHELELLRPLIHAFLEQFTRLGTQDKVRADATSVLLLLDHVVALGRLDFLADKLASLPESGIKPMLAVQRLDQLETLYGPGNGIWGRCAIRIILRMNQVSAAEQAANAICAALEQGAGKPFPGRPIRPADLMQMKIDEAFILGAAGHPIHTVVRPYFRDSAYQRCIGTPNTNPFKSDAPVGAALKEQGTMIANAGSAMTMTNVERVKALKKILRTFHLAKDRASPIAWRIYGPIVVVFMLWSLAAAKGWHYGMEVAVPVALIALAAIYSLLRTVGYRDYWCMLFDLLVQYEPQAIHEYRCVQTVVKNKEWSEFEYVLRHWYTAERALAVSGVKPNPKDEAAALFANKPLREAQPVVREAPQAVWEGYAYPLKQITVLLQGTRHSEREHVIGQLHTVGARLLAGDMAGTEHDDDFGYSFKVEHVSQGPSFFDGDAGRA